MLNHKKVSGNRNAKLLPIPNKVYFTIGEVASLCQLEPHVLRYWEKEFSQLSPAKRTGNRRYYQQKDIILVRQIRELLYQEGYTIDGARQRLHKLLNEQQMQQTVDGLIASTIAELEEIVAMLT